MRPDDKAREAAIAALLHSRDLALSVRLTVPDRGSVQFAADGSCFVECSLFIPAEALK